MQTNMEGQMLLSLFGLFVEQTPAFNSLFKVNVWQSSNSMIFRLELKLDLSLAPY